MATNKWDKIRQISIFLDSKGGLSLGLGLSALKAADSDPVLERLTHNGV